MFIQCQATDSMHILMDNFLNAFEKLKLEQKFPKEVLIILCTYRRHQKAKNINVCDDFFTTLKLYP